MKLRLMAFLAYGLALIMLITGVLFTVLDKSSVIEAGNATPTPRGPEVTPVPGAPLVTADDFLYPPLKNRPYRMVHSWKSAMDNYLAKTIDQKLDYLLDIGYGGVVTNVEWNTKYMQDENEFSYLNDILGKATSRSMGIWLYDESGFPSGPEHGLTLEGHPEYEAIGTGEVSLKGNGKANSTIAIPQDMQTVLTASIYPTSQGMIDLGKGQSLPLNITDKKLSFQGIEGDWEVRLYGVYPVYVDGVRLGTDSLKLKYPNLLNKDAVARYIEVSYQQYKNHIPDFDNIIQAFFYDEPALQTSRFEDGVNKVLDYPLVPWEGTLAQKFQAAYGYDLLKYLPSLFGGATETDKQVRQNYYELIGNMLYENWTSQISAWCEKNGSASSGHLLCEESMGTQIPLYGDFMKVMSGESYPGVDVLNLIPEKFTTLLLRTVKMAQSTARNKNAANVMCELCPAMDEGDTKLFDANHHEMALGMAGLLYLNGITQLNEYYIPDRTSKEQGRIFNTYVARMDYMLDGAKQASSIGVLYPTKTAQQYQLPSKKQAIYDVTKEVTAADSTFANLTRQLTSEKLDYSILIEDVINSATVKDGRLMVGDNKYSVLILPGIQVLPLQTMQKIDQFAKDGGEVIFLDTLPAKSNKMSENEQVKALAQQHKDKLISSSPVGNFENLVLNAKVTASNTDTSNAIYSAANVTDGIRDTASWNSWAGSTPATIDIDLGSPKSLNTIVLYTLKGYELGSFSVQYKDGDAWKDISKLAINSKDVVTIPFTAITAQYIRINALKGSSAQPGIGRIIEVEAYNVEKTNSKSLLERVRESCNLKLKLAEASTADANKLLLAQFMKNNRKFCMVANSSATAVTFSVEEAGAKNFTIYNPYDGSITKTDKSITISGYRALFIEPNF